VLYNVGFQMFIFSFVLIFDVIRLERKMIESQQIGLFGVDSNDKNKAGNMQ